MTSLFGELNAIETICFLTIKNQLDRFLISIPNPNNTEKSIDIYISPDSSPKIDVDVSTNSPYIKVKLKFTGRIDSMSENSDYLSPDILNYVSSSCNNYLETVFSDFLYKTSKDLKSDICAFGNNALSKFTTSKQLDEYQWLENFKYSFFDVEVDTTIKSSMLLTETKKKD
jgi:hypothetical protein